jgi:hypothetical protein
MHKVSPTSASPTRIKHWDADEADFTLEVLEEVIQASHETEDDITDLLGGDLLTVPTILQGLIDRIRELEKTK